MKWIKGFKKYQESLQIDLTFDQIDLMESLSIWHDVLLNSILAEKVDLLETLKLDSNFNDNLDIDVLSENVEFINSLSSIGLKKSPIQNTDDFQTFVNKPCKFMLLYDFNSSELENPIYILFQTWNETLKKWDDAKLYKINDDIKKFYDKLTSKTIEIIDGSENYIYTTSNGNDWELQNLQKQSDKYLRNFRKEDLQKLLDTTQVKVNII